MEFWELLLSAAALALPWAGRRIREHGPGSGGPLAGIWRERSGGELVGYLYFADRGAVYYMASRIPATEEMFTEKYKIAASRWGRRFSRWSYAAGRSEAGELLLTVSGEGIGGVYEKVS